jgi:hypothetical protein
VTAHVPRLENAGVVCDTAYCAACERNLRSELLAIEGETAIMGPWVAVWSRSAACTGPPLRLGA